MAEFLTSVLVERKACCPFLAVLQFVAHGVVPHVATISLAIGYLVGSDVVVALADVEAGIAAQDDVLADAHGEDCVAAIELEIAKHLHETDIGSLAETVGIDERKYLFLPIGD